METPKNSFKQKALAQETSYGIWNGLVDTVTAEIIAGAGFDWILVDGEHAPFDLRTIQLQLQTIAAYNVQVVVRPPVGDTVLIKQLMDIGVQSLLVPMVETAAQATQLVKAMRYPPEGVRGVGTALARASKWNRTNNYFRDANNEMCLICQIESVEGIKNLDAILAVEGVDGVFIGPADLGASMGYLGKPSHPDVKAAVVKAIKTIIAAGKTAGTLAVNQELVNFYKNAGANMFGVGVDTLLMAKATKELAELYKPELKNNQSNTKY
ncbi:aldolase/citrate lyase family protein [Polaribacter sp. L3A8]|uniref:aldolase/citrate lyase family protein n=1 Tax=Polaribacter sp. L3A8 TaxID=2686361 RepID=UPI00131E591D|nr:HpcH/HpaI aldolase/citrate lyase family protein [Polaribacter sp. L3A8]